MLIRLEDINMLEDRVPWPCPKLVKASHGATVHEATFEYILVEEAIAGNHSTIVEAIEAQGMLQSFRYDEPVVIDPNSLV